MYQKRVADRHGVCADEWSRPINKAVCLSCPLAVLEGSIRTNRPALPTASRSAPLRLFALFVIQRQDTEDLEGGMKETEKEND